MAGTNDWPGAFTCTETEADLSVLNTATRRRVILIVSVMLLAFSAGHIMQNVLARDMHVAVRSGAKEVERDLRRASQAPGLPVPPAATLTPFKTPEFAPSDRITDDPPLPEPPQEDASARPLGAPCRIEVDAIAGDAGLIWLEIAAPCSGGEVVTVAQAGMVVDWALDEDGRLSVDLPALTATPVVAVRFPDGLSESVSVSVPEAGRLTRGALVWGGSKVLGLHAFVGDADFGAEGHIHAAKHGFADLGSTTGFMTQLGDGSGAMAEVYTFPISATSVRLLAEAEVTSQTCGRIADVLALQSDPLGGLSSREVRLTMPSCDNLGDIVSLTMLFNDVRLAAR
ncbi:hypothetical protein BOA8489_03054 [Boseongicola aestuarii]|uniref:Translocase n=1 Tax=Boseongicola aestuarii TaxID=1470561 RepID=A0A238J3M7_9RHOB|nr:hypothetical protein BOA8489_03054 [Boseongicola aestuarii]